MEENKLNIEDDIENVLKILPKDIEANWPDKKDFFKYCKEIGNLNLQQLQKEKQNLQDESIEIAQQIQDLAISNYKKFIETAENTRNIYKEFATTETRLNELVDKLPDFEQQYTNFTQESNDISLHRRLSTLMFQKTSQLTDFLQLPELMEISIADGNYEDALEIVDFIRRLAHKYPDIQIFSILLSEVEKLWLIIVQKLLTQLRSDIQLPKCLQAVGYLRCMNIFTEAELRLKFLQTRDSWLQSILDEIPKDKPSQHLSKVIELSRIHIFQIITQYNAIFSDDNKSVITKNDEHINEAAIFQSWIQEKISQFLKTMEHDLNECDDGSSFGSTLSQCMYFGLSFSKVGCDFRGLIAPIITKCIKRYFKQTITNGTKKFQHDMDSFTLINKVYTTSSSGVITSSGSLKHDSNDTTPKLENIQDFYPLAEYCNSLLTAFNDLRVCAPFALVYHVTQTVQHSLKEVANIILLFYQHEHQAFTEIANEQFTLFCKCFVYELIPYIQNCIKLIYPTLHISKYLGVPVTVLEKGKYLTLDRSMILESIQHLILPLNNVLEEEFTTASSPIAAPSQININENENEILEEESKLVDENTVKEIINDTS